MTTPVMCNHILITKNVQVFQNSIVDAGAKGCRWSTVQPHLLGLVFFRNPSVVLV